MASTGEPFGLFWDSDGGDRTYSAGSFESWLKKFFTSGVFNGDLQVQVSSGMTLVVGSGYTNVDGKVKFWNANFNVTLDAANSTYPRIDTVVIRRDNVNRQITCEKVTGQYSGDTPQPTAPTRNGEIYELVLAQILVPAGATEVLASNITDTRPNTSLCGYITGTVEELDFSAFTAQFEAYFAEFKATKVADFNAWEQTQVAAYAAWFDNVKAEQIADKADWDEWYADLQEELHNLPADSAEYLQIQIDEIRENGTTGSIFHITTTNTELEGKTVTVSCGSEVKTATFDANLECTVIGFKSVGNVTFTSTDGIQTATKILDIDYYSKYEVPIAFWSATVNIQGDDNLKGATITVKDSDDTTVATIVLNVITGQGVFSAQKADTYTFNYTFSGTNYSEELVVDEETTYSLELSAGFSWTVWVDTARDLDSTDYDSLDEVLADEKALRELFLEHACVDYMAELTSSNEDLEIVINNDLCAKWINLSDYALDFLHANEVIADLMDEADKYFYGEWVITDSTTTPPTWGPKGNVPVMTANNAPYGTVSASTQYDNDYGAWRAFDGGETSATNYWSSTSGSVSNQWLSYKFVNPVNVKRLFILANIANNDNKMPKDCKLQYSNDGTNWVDVATFTNPQTTVRNYQDTPNNIYALYWRVFFVNNYGDSQYMYVREIQFYGRELKVSVPTMTSNTAPFGEASESSNHSSNPAWKAFDGDVSTRATVLTDTTTNTAHSITYKFVNPVCVRRMFFSPSIGTYTRNTVSFKVQGSNDGTTFTDIYTESSYTPSEAEQKTIVFDNAENYLYYRLWFSGGLAKTSGNAYFTYIYTVQFYGLDYSEKEFEAGTTKKWLYDHGVELESFYFYKNNSDCVADKDDDSLVLSIPATVSRIAFAYVSLDISAFDLMRAKLENGELYGRFGMGVSTSSTPSSDASSFEARSTIEYADSKDTPNNISLNVSSCNGNKYVGPIIRNASNGAAKAKMLINELWLE